MNLVHIGLEKAFLSDLKLEKLHFSSVVDGTRYIYSVHFAHVSVGVEGGVW